MVKTNLKTTNILSVLIIILMLTATISGIFVENLYQDDNVLITMGWFANDLVTLFSAIPLLIGSLIFSRKGSVRSYLVLLGVLNYTLYNFSFYLFGAALNILFIVYVALFNLAMFGLIFGLVNFDINTIRIEQKNNAMNKWISGFMIILAGILTIAWIGQWLNFVVKNQLPQILINLDSTTFLVAALDLTLVIPGFTLAAIWLWQGKVWGYVIAIIMNIKGFLYNIVLTTGSLYQESNGIEGANALVPLWIFLGIGCLASFIILLKKLKTNHR